MVKGSETSTANAANANTNFTWGLVTAGAINEEIWDFTLDSPMAKYLMPCTIFVTLVRMAKIFATGTHHPQTRT